MSNRKMWKKCIKYKSILKRDRIYKSYWIRKFIKKLVKHTNTQKTEIFLYKTLSKIKSFMRPIVYFFKILLKKTKWLITTHLKRMGKYFHKIPTYIPTPKCYKHGLLNLKKVINYNKLDKSFFKRFNLELNNIFFCPKDSSSLKLKKKNFLLIQQNKAYTHFRWR